MRQIITCQEYNRPGLPIISKPPAGGLAYQSDTCHFDPEKRGRLVARSKPVQVQ